MSRLRFRIWVLIAAFIFAGISLGQQRSVRPYQMNTSFETTTNWTPQATQNPQAASVQWFNRDSDIATSNPDWMGQLPDELLISELSIPGTHGTMYLHGSWVVKTQTLTLEKQLDAGIRAFDIRCRHVENVFAMHHNAYFQNAFFGNDVLAVAAQFLVENPTETILMRVKKTHTEQDCTRSFSQTFEWYLNQWNSFIWQPDDYSQFPALEEVRGKIIILQDFDSHRQFGPYWGSLRIQDSYTVLWSHPSMNGKWNKIRNHLSAAAYGDPGDMYVNFTSGSGGMNPVDVARGIWIPFQYCQGMNERTYLHLQWHNLFWDTRMRTGAVMMDFPGASLIEIIIAQNGLGPRFDSLEISDSDPPEGWEVTLSGEWSNFGASTATVTVDWDDGSPVDLHSDNTGPFAFPHYYADDGVYLVTACVENSDGSTCESIQVVVHNLPPTVDAGADLTTFESGSVELQPAVFNDPGTLDTHTYAVNWGDELPPQVGPAAETPFGPPGSVNGMDGTVTSSHTYGDNGVFMVDVCVTDDDGGTGCDTLEVLVENVDPALAPDGFRTVSLLGGGEALLAQIHDPQEYGIDVMDAGSDDLTIEWEIRDSFFGGAVVDFDSRSYCNDPDQALCADLLPSSQYHHYPMLIEGEKADVTFTEPGVYDLSLNALDDDGGLAEVNLPVVVVDDCDCIRRVSHWRNEYGDVWRSQTEREHLLRYLHAVEFASPSFSEFLCPDTHDDACLLTSMHEVLAPGGPDIGDHHPSNLKGKALAECVASWLDFASGAVEWDAQVDPDGEMFHQRMARAEAILMDPDSSHHDYLKAAKLAREASRYGSSCRPWCTGPADPAGEEPADRTCEFKQRLPREHAGQRWR